MSKPMLAGWYKHGLTPGEAGPAVILGHVDNRSGPAIFYRLRELKVGDKILINRRDHTIAPFVVYRTELVSKSEFPTEKVYGPSRQPELRLVTCAGPYDGQRGYEDNLIVYAVLAREPRGR